MQHVFLPFRRDIEESYENVILNPLWHNADKTISTYKTPTCLLLNEKRELEAFGYEAEKKYLELFHQGRHERCFFFRRYKTKIHGIQVCIVGHRPVIVKRELIGSKGGWIISTIFMLKSVS